MGTAKEIEQAVLHLSASELQAFREWFLEFEASAWDRQLESDIAAGRLDMLADRAIKDLNAGSCKKL